MTITPSFAARAALASLLLAALTGCGNSSGTPAALAGGGTTPPPTTPPVVTPPTTASAVAITTLSNRADLLSGGDALTEITLPSTVDASTLKVTLEGRDVSSSFARRANGRVMGLVEGMNVGSNTLVAKLPDGSGAVLTLTNHPQNGPVFSGPQIQPWACAAGAKNPQCDRDAVITWQYKSSRSNQFATYNPAMPPTDVANTTTDNGTTVPYIVRVETGAIDRDEYKIAVVWDPAKPWTAWEPQAQFNRKLVITHGASCDTHYQAGAASDVMNDTALGKGFAVMSNALNNSGHNCNVVVQAESMMMTKERVIEQLGELRYTIGSGCSGGALAQYWMANAYPGLYQGISPACSFADAWSSAQQYTDYVMLRAYFENPSKWAPGVAWPPTALQAVYGHPNPVNPVTFTEVIPNSGKPIRSCTGVPAAQVYHPTTNPSGVRCTLHDYTVNVFGRRPPELWTEVEKKLGRGFAQRPAGNIGIQFGIKGLMAGTLSAAQFVDVNQKIGGLDPDYNATAARSDTDPDSVRRVYRSGSVNVANNLDQVAIIDLRGPDPGAFHDAYRAYALRARLDREHGTHANQLIWRGPTALFGDTSFTGSAILALDQWLGAIEKDKRLDIPLPIKVLENKPTALVERCTNGAGQDVPAASCDAVVQAYSSPRIEAGMPFTDDVIKCQLKPLVRSDYGTVVFTDAQWASLNTVFPTGVCDYSKPGVDFTPTVPWLTYKDGPEGVPVGAAPASRTLQ